MDTNDSNPLSIIEEANSKTLAYFNKTYMDNLELVQNLKTELFELEVQIETLEKTRDLYTYQTDTRRNVFSPLSDEASHTMTKGKQIALQIKDLQDARQRLEKRIADLEEDIRFYKEQVSMLSKANRCIHTVLTGEASPLDTTASEDAIEFIEKEDETPVSGSDYTMLRFEDHAHRQCAEELDQNVKQELISNLNKMDVLRWLLHSDIGRAKVTLDELHHSQQQILNSVEDILDDLDYHIDIKQPIWDQVDKLIHTYQQKHPECMIDAACNCTEHEMNLPAVITIRLIRMLREVFDNIFKHSNANRVTSKIFISSRLIDVYINDNGVGIPEDYLDRSDWSSGLHWLHETIRQLDGKLQITGDLISGTNVRFSFPIKNQ